MITQFFKKDLEILISTMNRDSLDFLNPMFADCDLNQFNILIINQTTKNHLLVSKSPSIRVVNSFEIGISKSRNLAILNSKCNILLFTDDDVVFVEKFDENILKAYNKYPYVAAICFQTLTTQGLLYSKYPKKEKFFSKKELVKVLSIEMSCSADKIKKSNVKFNEYFGLGAQFQDSETFFFLSAIHKLTSSILFYPKNIVIHAPTSSSDEASSDRIIYARMAGFYKRFGFWAYILLMKYMFFLWRKYNFTFLELRNKFFVGLKSIDDYKLIVGQKLDLKYD